MCKRDGKRMVKTVKCYFKVQTPNSGGAFTLLSVY
ncbi:hypothetical protein Lser_V15G23029 [Lactuca serriola]